MGQLESIMTKDLLDRLLATRARRDREKRYSEGWEAADSELHQIERAIFRVPLDLTENRPTRPQSGSRPVSPGPRRWRRLRRLPLGPGELRAKGRAAG